MQTHFSLCHHFCMLCCLCLESLCCVFSLFSPKAAAEKFREAGSGWKGAGQCNPGYPVGENKSVLGLLLSCWSPASCTCRAKQPQGVYVEVRFWDVCPMLNTVYFSPAPQTWLSKPPPLAFAECFLLCLPRLFHHLHPLLKTLLMALNLYFQSPL